MDLVGSTLSVHPASTAALTLVAAPVIAATVPSAGQVAAREAPAAALPSTAIVAASTAPARGTATCGVTRHACQCAGNVRQHTATLPLCSCLCGLIRLSCLCCLGTQQVAFGWGGNGVREACGE